MHMGANSSTTETDVDLVFRQNSRATFDLLRLVHAQRQAPDLRLLGGDLWRWQRGFDDDASCEALAKLRPLNAYGWSKHVVDRRIARLRRAGRCRCRRSAWA